MRRWRRAQQHLTLAMALCAATPVWAAEPEGCEASAPAARLAESGLRAYRDAQGMDPGPPRVRLLERAVLCFQRARASSSEGGAKLDHPLGLAYEKLGRDAEAYGAFDAFLRSVPEAARLPGVTSQVRGKLDALRARVGLLGITAAPGARIEIDGEAVGVDPLGHLLPVAPGGHLVSAVTPPAPPSSRAIVARAGQVLQVELSPRVTDGRVMDAPLPPRPGATQARAAAGLLGVGLLLGGGGAALWALADRPTCGDPAGAVTCPSRLPPPALGIALVAAGTATLGVSLTLYLLSRRHSAEAPRVSAHEPRRAQRTPSEGDTHSAGTAARAAARSESVSP